MNSGKNVLLGILAIILGLLIIVFPIIGDFTVSIVFGMGIVFLGIWLLTQCFKLFNKNLAASIADLILGVIAIFIGLGFLGNIKAVSFITILGAYIVGFLLLFAGITTLISAKNIKVQLIGILGMALGIIYMIIGIYAAYPLVLAVLIGAFLIMVGIAEIFIVPDTEESELEAS
jgi:membrane protein HdeD